MLTQRSSRHWLLYCASRASWWSTWANYLTFIPMQCPV